MPPDGCLGSLVHSSCIHTHTRTPGMQWGTGTPAHTPPGDMGTTLSISLPKVTLQPHLHGRHGEWGAEARDAAESIGCELLLVLRAALPPIHGHVC